MKPCDNMHGNGCLGSCMKKCYIFKLVIGRLPPASMILTHKCGNSKMMREHTTYAQPTQLSILSFANAGCLPSGKKRFQRQIIHAFKYFAKT